MLRREAPRLEEPDDVGDVVELPVERAAEVDDVGAALPVVLRRAHDLLAGQVRHVVDLGEDPDVVGAVLLLRAACPKCSGRSRRSAGPFSALHAPAVLDRPHVALAEAGDDDPLGARGVREVPGDPRGRHQRGDRDAEDRHLVGEVGRHARERRPERGLGELAGDEQGLGHRASEISGGALGVGRSGGLVRAAALHPLVGRALQDGSPRQAAT